MVHKITEINPISVSQQINLLLESLSDSCVCQSFMDLMYQSILDETADASVRKDSQNISGLSWLELPGLCCQAMGGDPQLAAWVTAAWGSLYTAAHTIDTIEDNDRADPWWAELGPAAAINAATGLYAGSTLFLLELSHLGISHSTIIEILSKFHQTILRMCSGQHIDITTKRLSLDEYWQVAESKSGSFFGLACYAGARLATDDPSALSCLLNFGTHLGVLIQIGDDAKDIYSSLICESSKLNNPFCLLPIVYTMEVSSHEKCSQLCAALEGIEENPTRILEVREILEHTGAGLYLITKAEQHRQEAILALDGMDIKHTIYNRLNDMLDQVSLLKKA
jgi:geranylgeranyl pyrophosphate synthase